MISKRVIMLVLVSLGFSAAFGCGLNKAAVVATPYRAPFAPAATYGVVMIDAAVDPTNKKEMEKNLAAILSKSSATRYLTQSSLFFIGQKFSEREYLKVLKDNNVEAVLTFALMNAQAVQSTSFVPTFSTTSGYVGSTNFNATTGGVVPVMTSSTIWDTATGLYDMKMKKTVWFVSARTGGRDYAAMKKALVKETAKQLLSSGLVQTVVEQKQVAPKKWR